MKSARRTLARLSLVFFAASFALAAFGLNDVAQDVARKTAEDAAAGNPYAMVLLIAVFVIAGSLWATNQAATIWAKVRGKETAPAIQEQLRRIEEKVDLLWDDMNQRRGAEKAKGVSN